MMVDSRPFHNWTSGRTIETVGTNAGAAELPFQAWRRFKEAFAPELIEQAVRRSSVPVRNCVDPFGGSGTTALACQFLGVHPITIEVNPFLADLIEAKLTRYDCDRLVRDFSTLTRRSRQSRQTGEILFRCTPATFLEPGVEGRWIFSKEVGDRLAQILDAIGRIGEPAHQRFFRVILAGVLVDVSRVTISGKGRRYRRGHSGKTPEELDRLYADSVQRAIGEAHQYAKRPGKTFDVQRGDCRQLLRNVPGFELSVFSPPYPNSFDYTDVYNLELWVLGYLQSGETNQSLRRATLSSHVQIKRNFSAPPGGSVTLDRTMRLLRHAREGLWNKWIPDMVGGYFADLANVLASLKTGLARKGKVWMVVGDSRYGGVHVPVGKIIGELAVSHEWRIESSSPCRSMRVSPQQGGQHRLQESLLVLMHA